MTDADCKGLGEAVNSPKRLFRTDGGGCKCCHFHLWVLQIRSKYNFIRLSLMILPCLCLPLVMGFRRGVLVPGVRHGVKNYCM